MTTLKISMAFTALTLTLAPQAQAYATADDAALAPPPLVRLSLAQPQQSVPPETGICEVDILHLLAQAGEDRPDSDDVLICLAQ